MSPTVKSDKKIIFEYWHIAWPASLEGLLIVMLSSVELFMVSSLGEYAIASVGIFGQPKMVILCFSRSIALAVTVTTAVKYGAKKLNDLPLFVKQATGITITAAAIIFLLTSFFMQEILLIAGAEPKYLDHAINYALIANTSLFFQGIAIVLNGALIGLGKTKAMLYSNVSGNIINVICNYILIYQLNFGVQGAAIATVLGSITALSFSLFFVCRKDSPISIAGPHNWLPTSENFQTLMKIFKGVFLEQGFERVGMFLYYYFVAKLGVISFATHCICMTLCDIFYNFGQGFSKASLSLSAKIVGQAKNSKIKDLTKNATILCFFWASLAFALYFFFRQQLISLYSNDATVIVLGAKILIFVAISSFPQTLSLCYSGILRGTGHTNYVAKYSFWSIAVIRPIITYIFIFILNLDLYGAWLALLIDQTLRMICAAKKVKEITN